jgi:transketolase
MDDIEIRTLSMLGQRGTLGLTLSQIGVEQQNIVALSADLRTTSGLDRFAKAFPDRFINTGIAEQNMVGIAAGLAENGYVPFATSFANFSVLRANEFVRHFMGYMEENIKLVGMGAGFAMGMFGNTHYGVEDIAAIRSFPNITILSPADGLETKKAVIAAANYKGPVYLRLYGEARQPIVYKEDFDFQIGKANLLRSGNDAAILATGGLVYPSLQAAQELERKGIHIQIWDVHTLSGIDKEAVDKACETEVIFTAEEHRVIGGLGSAVAEQLSEKRRHPQLVRLGVPMHFDKAGSNSYCLKMCGLDSEGIKESVITELEKMKS